VLTQAGYRVGRYTSPHLVDWTERICLNEQPISNDALQQLLLQVQDAILPQEESPTQFEVITAAAWLYFAQSKVDIAVVEVGLGGRLDATNVCSPACQYHYLHQPNTGSSWGQRWQILLGRKPVSSNLGVQLLWDHYHQQLICGAIAHY